LGGPRSRFGQGGEEKKWDRCFRQKLSPSSPACSKVTILTELSQLLDV